MRRLGSYPEGVTFAILTMNALVPLIDRTIRPRIYGHGRRERHA
jgi:electron transport complex protein RnfD